MPSFEEKQQAIKASFSSTLSQEEIYKKIMEWRKHLPLFREEWKVENKRVTGCQSILYLHTETREGRLIFYASSDALISAGLASLLIYLYSGETAEVVLMQPPLFFEECKISESLTVGRANGFASLYLRMKQEALSYLSLPSS